MIQLQAVVPQQELGLFDAQVRQILVDSGSRPAFKKTGKVR